MHCLKPPNKNQYRWLLSLVCGEVQQERWLFWCSSEAQWGIGWIEGPVASWASTTRSVCLCVRKSNTVCCSNMLMMLARGAEITLGVYFIDSLLMSGPGAHPLLRHPCTCATSIAVTGWLSGRGLPMNGSSHSSDWSENCFATIHEWHQLYLDPFLHLPSWVWIVNGGGCLVDFMA